MAQPLVDVFSINIFPNTLPCKIYGDITVSDEDDTEVFKLYQRGAEHAEVISNSGEDLLLLGLDIVLTMRKPVISILLKDRAQNDALLASGIVHLDNNTNSNDFEQFESFVVKGYCGHARVNYVALACAVVAEVRCEPYDLYGEEDSDNRIDLYGTIDARYGKTFGPKTYNKRFTLSYQTIPVAYDEYNDAYLQFTRKLVAVPAYSSLIIEANVRERLTDKEYLSGAAIFLATHSRTFSSALSKWDDTTQLLHIGRENANLKVRWLEPFRFQYSSTNEWLALQMKKESFLDWWGDCLLEVFSVIIGWEDDGDLDVFGKITVQCASARLTLFERDDKNPVKLLNGRKISNGRKLLSIACPSNFMNSREYFHIRVDLKDANDRLLIKDGAVHFTQMLFADQEEVKYEYDRLLCAVIQGERSYCIVHYANFDRAVWMEVRSVLLCKGVDVPRVYGRIVAWSDMFDYTSDYAKSYYRRVLFDNPEDNVEFLRKVVSKKTEEGSSDERKLKEVELCRSYVVMPVGFTMCFDVNLHASFHSGRGPAQHLQNTLRFQLADNSPRTIVGEDFDIVLHMKLIDCNSSDESDKDEDDQIRTGVVKGDAPIYEEME